MTVSGSAARIQAIARRISSAEMTAQEQMIIERHRSNKQLSNKQHAGEQHASAGGG
jgi:hypothetical protein